jgi:hypothetical protein
MLSCVLRIDGRDFKVDRYLRTTGLVADCVYRRGEKLRAGVFCQTSGFTVLVSEPENEDFSTAVADVVSFLRGHRGELEKLREVPGVDGMNLDFGRGFKVGEMMAQSTRLPVELIEECAEIGIEIELSIYAVG